METPICVVDAQTLIEHIHEIKRWIYSDQLHIVVSSSTYDHVEEIFQKSKEVKLATKETPRSKVSGKPPKKEYPAFDINPTLAKNFLLRLKTWKNKDAAAEQREFLQEKENHAAVSFQSSSEQYTPWKDVEMEEEPQQVVEDRPTTWADALRRKQSQANGIGGNFQTHKAPAKPKLVAKTAGPDSSPWKIKKDAPKISAKDVPGNLRPLMSCILWRLHEGIDRNDVNELFLLSDQTEIRMVAHKLNISVRSTEELAVLVAAKAKVNDLEAYGDLEREFNLEPKASKVSSVGRTTQNGSPDALPDPSKSLEKSNTGENESKPEDGHAIDGGANTATEKGKEEPYEIEDLKNGSTTIHAKETSIESIEINGKAPETTASSTPLPNVSGEPMIQESQPEESSVTSVLLNAESGRDVKASDILIVETPSEPTGQLQPMSGKSNDSNAASVSAQPNTEVQEPEDSDEEVVVFVPQPKRFSNQRKPVQQSSRPSTPITQSGKQAKDQSPRPSPGTVHAQPKPPGRSRNPIVTNQSHPQPTASPTVIDPDAFGRSFAVNPNPGPRTLHNPRSHHRPRHSAENASFHQSNASANQHTLRTSASRESTHRKPSGLSPAPEPRTHQDQGAQDLQNQRTSPHRRSKNTKTKNIAPQGHGLIGDESRVQIQPKSLAARMVESEEFVPRSAFKDSQLGAIGTQPVLAESQSSKSKITNPSTHVKPTTPEPRTVDSNSFSSRNLKSNAEANTHAGEPGVSDSNDFIPRSAMPTMQYYRRTPEPEANEPRTSMPDVQYVLKSGSTRAATRGRGRLWTPS